MSEIDFGFIKELEGFRLTGYVPKEKGKELGTSGVTIASGFDLGAHNINDLAGLPEDLIQKFSPYLGLKGKEASNKASLNCISLIAAFPSGVLAYLSKSLILLFIA